MPSIASIPQAVRNAARLQQVISVLAKYGLARWLHRIPLDWLQNLFRTSQGDAIVGLSWSERVREAMAELGTTFIKIGQILSTRPDIIGPDLADKLSGLQSNTPPDKFPAVRELLEKELQQPLASVFATFEEEPFASASIGQVHLATLHDGRRVAVKVQHIGIEDNIRSDLEIAQDLASLVEAHSTEAALYRPVATIAEASRSLLKELDFRKELRNAQIFARHFRDDPTVRFPRMFPELSTRRILTMEYLEGTELSQIDDDADGNIDRQALAEHGAGIFLEMVFRDGFFHADPHPGNMLVMNDGVIGVLDCGMVGRIDDMLRDQFEDLLLAAVDGDSDRVVDSIITLGELPDAFDRRSLTQDIVEFFDHYSTMDFNEFELSTALNDATEIIRRQNIRLPSRLSMLIRMLAVLEGTAERLSPSFNMVDLLRPYRGRIVKRRLSPRRMRRRLLAAYRQWNHLLDIAPGDIADIPEKIKQGRFDVHLDHRRLDGLVSRLVRGIIVSSLFVGSSLLWSRSVPPLVYDYSVPGVFGSGLAFVLGARLLADLRKPGDH